MLFVSLRTLTSLYVVGADEDEHGSTGICQHTTHLTFSKHILQKTIHLSKVQKVKNTHATDQVECSFVRGKLMMLWYDKLVKCLQCDMYSFK